MKPNLHSPLDAEEAGLAARYASLPGAEPSPALDARVLAHAHGAVRRRSPLLRWGGAAAAVLALGVGIRVVMAPIDMTPREEDMAPAATAVPTERAAPAEADSNVLMDSAPQAETAVDRADPAAGARTSTPTAAPAAAPPGAAAAAPAGPRDEPAPLARREPPAERQATRAPPPAPAASEAARATPQARDAMRVPPAPAPAAPMAAPASAPAPAPPAPVAFPAPAAAVTAPESGRAPSATPMPDQQRSEVRERAMGASKAAPLSAAEQEAALSAEGMASLDELVEEARRLYASGDAAGLRALLRRLAASYPDAPLPADVQAWLDALPAER